jgi:hypothetical protein
MAARDNTLIWKWTWHLLVAAAIRSCRNGFVLQPDAADDADKHRHPPRARGSTRLRC